MFGDMKQKELILIYAVIGFGSVALVALGELSGVDPGTPLFAFYFKLVFGGFLVFYAVLFHFGLLATAKKIDKKRSKIMRFLFGERASRITISTIVFGVLVYWIYSFAELMGAYDINFF